MDLQHLVVYVIVAFAAWNVYRTFRDAVTGMQVSPEAACGSCRRCPGPRGAEAEEDDVTSIDTLLAASPRR